MRNGRLESKKKSSPDNERRQNRLRARQKSISRLSYFCSEHYLGSVGPVPVFSSVSSGRHWTAAVIQTHHFPLSHPLLTPVLLSPYAHKVICFSTGSKPRSVPGESIHWQDEKSRGPGRITRPPLCPANLEVRRGGWSFKQSAPSFIIHATALKIFFRQHHISSSPILRPALLLLLSLSSHRSSLSCPPPAPLFPRQSIHKV